MRAALGATRQDLLRQLIVESVVLAGVAMVLALGLCLLLLSVPLPLGPRQAAAALTEYRVDTGVAIFSALLALAVGVGCGLAAGVLAAPGNLYRSLQEGAAGSDSRSQGRLRALLVVLEVSVAVVLLVGSGLLARTLQRLSAADLGMQPRGLVVQQVDLPATMPDPEVVLSVGRLLERVGGIPGVESVAAIYPSPLSGSGMATAANPSDRVEASFRASSVRSMRDGSPSGAETGTLGSTLHTAARRAPWSEAGGTRLRIIRSKVLGVTCASGT